jgi:predicted alpha/beta hydrolase family esterase
VKRQLLFIQGGGAGVHDEWDNKLVESLGRELGPNYEIRYPRMPNEDEPSYVAWKATLEREFAALADGAILIGHSLGGTILVNALVEQPSERAFGAIFLRCAGAALATFLARSGAKVLVVERDRLHSDHVISTHTIHPPGVAILDELGAGNPLRSVVS